MRTMTRRGAGAALLGLGAVAWGAAPARAAGPPLRILVGFAPGGSVDVVARLLADPLSRSLDRPVVIENRAGAGGQVAAGGLKSSPPDGGTVMLCPDHVSVIIPLTIKEPGFDPSADFVSLGKAVRYVNGLAVSPSLNVGSVAEYQTWLKANPAKALYGVPAPGSVPQFSGFLVAQKAGVTLTPVPYRGAAPVVQDLMAGQIPAGVGALADMLPFHKDGKVRVIAVSGAARSALAPDVPTFEEAGIPGLTADYWYGFHAPRGTPASFVQAFSDALRGALAVPEVRDRLTALGLDPAFTTPDEMTKAIADGSVYWRPVIEASGYRKQ